MSARIDDGPFRSSASDDPRGTRAIAMALPSHYRNQLERAFSRLGTIATVLPLVAAVLVLLVQTWRAPTFEVLGWWVVVFVLGPTIVAVTRLFLAGARFQIREDALVVKDFWGRAHRVAWRDVETFECTSADRVRARVRIDGKVHTIDAPFVVEGDERGDA